MSTPETELWCAVISTAVEDLFSVPPGWRQGYNDWQRNKREAQLFLTKKVGEWATSRDIVCSAAGIDPDALRDEILQRMEDNPEED